MIVFNTRHKIQITNYNIDNQEARQTEIYRTEIKPHRIRETIQLLMQREKNILHQSFDRNIDLV